MKNNKINCSQFSSIFITVIITTFLGIGIFSTIKAGGVDSYLSILIAGIIGIVFLLCFMYISNYEPDLPLNNKIIKLYGKKLGFIIIIILCLTSISLGTTIMYNLNNFIISQFLSNTPYLIIGLVFAILIFYINIKGLDVLSRTSLILLIINFILFAILLFGLFPSFDIDNLKPFLADGLKYPIKGSFYIITLNIAPMFSLLIIPKNSLVDNENYNKYITISYIIALAVMFIVILYIIGTLGINLASYYQYPEYMILKKIELLNFIDRIENIIILQWIFGCFISLSTIVYFIPNMVIKNKKNYGYLIITAIILILSLILFKNNTIYNNISFKIIPYIRIITLVFAITTVIMIAIKRKIAK